MHLWKSASRNCEMWRTLPDSFFRLWTRKANPSSDAFVSLSTVCNLWYKVMTVSSWYHRTLNRQILGNKFCSLITFIMTVILLTYMTILLIYNIRYIYMQQKLINYIYIYIYIYIWHLKNRSHLFMVMHFIFFQRSWKLEILSIALSLDFNAWTIINNCHEWY